MRNGGLTFLLISADGCGTSEIMRRSGKAKPVVWLAGSFHGRRRRRPQARQDAQTRQAAAAGGQVRRVVDLALSAPPGEASHWTGRMLAKAAGVSLRSVQRILGRQRSAVEARHAVVVAAHRLASPLIRAPCFPSVLSRDH